MNAFRPIRRAGLACALALGACTAAAAPVVQAGSTWSLSLNRSNGFTDMGRYALRFDGVAETFVHSTDGLVSVTVQESQTDLGGGRAAIDLSLDFSGGDPYPQESMVILGIGTSELASAPGDLLDLTQPVALTAATVSARVGNGQLLQFDAMPDFRAWGQPSPWDGGLFGGRVFLGMSNWSMQGLQQITVHFETQALNSVPSPATLPLAGLGLLALALVRHRLTA